MTKVLYVLKEMWPYLVRLSPLMVTVVIFYLAPLPVMVVVALAWLGYFWYRLVIQGMNRSINEFR